MREKGRVLAVDDEPKNLKVVKLSLGDEWELQTASTGEEALQAASNLKPEVVLLDIMMPGIDGYEACRRLRGDPKLDLTKVILVSGKAMIDERIKGYEAGADDYLTKPFIPEELQAKVRVFMRLAVAERKLSELNRSLEEQVRERTRQLVDTEAKLVQSARLSALGEMAAGIAHEVNNPLAIIHTLSGQLNDLINEDPIDRTEATRLSRIILETAERIAGIVTGLRLFSRDGAADPFQDADLNHILESSFALCAEKFRSHSVDLRVSPRSGEIMIRCRETQVGQVLLNLLNNAYDAVSDLPEKWIRVDTSVQGEEIEIRVTDSGSGIPTSIRERIFEPFFTTKPVGKGTGLGLSISKGIMDSHQGSLAVDASCKNTCFVLRFPRKRKQPHHDVGMAA